MFTHTLCPICNSQSNYFAESQFSSGFFCACPRCGKYDVDSSLYSSSTGKIVIPEKLKSSIYYFLTQVRKESRLEDDRTIRIISESISNKEISDDGPNFFVSREGLLNIFPVDLDERVSMILVNFSNHCERPGDSIFRETIINNMSHLFFLKDGHEVKKIAEMEFWLETLINLGYVQKKTPYYLLTLEGWKRASNFAKEQSASKTAFVAMSFVKELMPARESIIRAIEKAGFTAMVIDTKEHNNQIMPEILLEIRKSRFVVADLTKQRNGVYYEAGYAEGLNIPVIAMCRDDDFDNVHFDLKQKNTIRWENPQDIFDKLVKRIEATLDLH